jgi:predicted nucleic acid-binding protein
VQPCATETILSEYEELLLRKSHSLDKRRAKFLFKKIRAACTMFNPQPGLSLAEDPDDTMFLECARAAKADYLVTGNVAHFPRGRWKYTRIATPRQFIELWGEGAP